MTHTYPKIVQQIHRDFKTASEVLLKEAQEITANTKVNVEKIDRLKKVGFTQASCVVKGEEEVQKLEMSKEISELILYYQMHYPNNKFITKDQVDQICVKYGLVCGTLENFIGFVPDKNLKEIESLKVKDKDKQIMLRITQANIKSFSNSNFAQKEVLLQEALTEINSEFEITDKEDRDVNSPIDTEALKQSLAIISGLSPRDINSISAEKYFPKMLICAPEKDFKFNEAKKTGNFIKEFFKTKIVDDDPVVLNPVIGGFLICTAWGDEASDPIVVNQKMN